MARVIAGVDLSAVFTDTFQNVLEPLVLEHLGAAIEVQGFWERGANNTQAVLMANLGGLEGIRPLANDVLAAGDQRAIVYDVQGVDEIVWVLRCATALDAIERAQGPNTRAIRTSAGTGVQITLQDPLFPSYKWRTRWRYGSDTGWSGGYTTENRVRHIAGLRATDVVVVESVRIDGTGTASQPTYVEVIP